MDLSLKTLLMSIGSLGSKLLKLLAFLLLLGVISYLGFKGWEYNSELDENAHKAELQTQQQKRFGILSKHLATYAPLMVGTSSLGFVQVGNGKTTFEILMGEDYSALLAALEKSKQMVYVGPQILGVGCASEDCLTTQGAFVIDSALGKVYAAITEDGKPIYYGVVDGSPIPPAFEKWNGFQKAEASK